jgi:ABC-2 type transport system permease protein
MNAFLSALWAEALKARRSKVPLLTAAGLSILPIMAGLFIFILKDPERARAMGLIGVKAQITAGVADWPTHFQVLVLGTAIGGAIVFSFITAWIFGREHADHTSKELLALPTSRGVIVAAKFTLTAVWTLGLALMVLVMGFGTRAAVGIPGWSPELAWTASWSLLLVGLLTAMLMPFVAFFASVGRGYLPPLGWAILMMALAQVAIVLGWGEWFPWSVPGLVIGLNGFRPELIAAHSYVVVLLAFTAGTVATFAWWRGADQAR